MSANTNQQDCKVTLYWLNQSRGQRIAWLLEELKLDYELKTFKRDKNSRAPAELKEIHPLGKSPAVGIEVPGAEKPVILVESGTLVEYLTDHFGSWMVPKRYPEGKEGVIGAETEEWMRYRYVMHYVEGSLFTVLTIAMFMNNIRKAPVPFFIKPITRMIANNVDSLFTNPEVALHLTFLEDYLASAPGGGDFFCGQTLTGADVMMIFALEALISRGDVAETSYPKLYSWVRRIQARDAYKRAGDRITQATGVRYVPFSEQPL
ncbi:glutathione transferase [Amniculicola lignicola CBS 123094]|uniref:Glutathione transferase n=1 Tax=Amniculicola lignicola CBS 123094 TaxID=1392246 RepID=A0A6A5WC03_9PLEO|nr:glutathione transferase [Amniculicola lignicola CBS 123094]